jgi:phosphopantetheine--protein transferase-like protein
MVNIKKNIAKNYFSKLLNSNIDENTILSLSSSQKARAHTWLKNNKLNADHLLLNDSFNLQQLIDEASFDSKKNVLSSQKKATKESTNFESNYIGIDIQNISELFPEGVKEDLKSDPELLDIFTTKELTYAQSKKNQLQTLTGLFAAKEAVQKSSEDKRNLIDIEILPNEDGKPQTFGFLVNISHSKDYAVAIAQRKKNKIGDEKNTKSKDIFVEKKSNLNLIILTLIGVLFLIEILRFF